MESLIESGGRRLAIVIGVMAATLLVTVDTTIVNVALPTIEGSVGANFDEGAWIVTGYIIAAVIVIPLTPWLQQLLGRRQYYVAAIAGFTVASALCGLSTSLSELVLFRIVQGLCGGGLISTGQAILRDTFPAKELGKSQALLALGAVGGPSIAPMLGGVLTDALSWSWVFYVNVVPGIAATVLLASVLRNPSYVRARTAFDGVGLVLLAIGLGSFQYVLDEGERYDWFSDPAITTLSILAGVSLAAFAVWELKRAKQPIVDLRILGNRTVAAGCGLALTIGFSLIGGIVLTPQFTQGLLGWTATRSGEAIMVRAVAMFAFTPVTLILLNRFRIAPPAIITVGFLLVAWANVMQAYVTTTDSSFWTFGPALIVGGVGFIMQFLPLSVAVLSSVQGPDTQKATSLTSLCQQVGGSFSTAMLVTLLDRREALHQSNLAAEATLRNPALAIAAQHHASLGALYSLVVQQASALAFADAFLFLGVVTMLFVPLILFLKFAKRPLTAQVVAE